MGADGTVAAGDQDPGRRDAGAATGVGPVRFHAEVRHRRRFGDIVATQPNCPSASRACWPRSASFPGAMVAKPAASRCCGNPRHVREPASTISVQNHAEAQVSGAWACTASTRWPGISSSCVTIPGSRLLFKEVLIGVTGFFRDPTVWQDVKDALLGVLQGLGDETRRLRAWVVGCSTGKRPIRWPCCSGRPPTRCRSMLPARYRSSPRISASTRSAVARRGHYPPRIAEERVAPARWPRFFVARGRRVSRQQARSRDGAVRPARRDQPTRRSPGSTSSAAATR